MAKQGKPKTAIEPVTMFVVAEQFRNAANCLNEAPNAREMYLPSIVCDAFALELYLKCLLLLENKPIPHGHNLAALFGRLSSATQAKIRSYFDADLPRLQAEVDSETTAKGQPRDIIALESALRRSGDAFTQMRYLHEPQNARAAWFAGNVKHAAWRVINDMHPDWAYRSFIPPSPFRLTRR